MDESLSLDVARRLVAAAVAEARKNGWRMAVAVVDGGGHLVCFERIDETQFGSIEVAIGKARTAAGFKRSTKVLEDAVGAGQLGYLSFPNLIPKEGGIPVVSNGKVVGGIGVSGETSAQDAQAARAGIEAVFG